MMLDLLLEKFRRFAPFLRGTESTVPLGLSSESVQQNPYNELLKRLGNDQNILGHYPLNLQIQTISACNATCYFCPHPESWQKSNPGRMTETTFRKIIDDVSSYKIGKFCPYLENEPLLDPDIFDRIEYGISKLDFNLLELATNASVLTPQKIEDIVRIFPQVKHQIWISFHGIDKENFNTIMGLDFDTCKENVLALVEKAQKHNLNILLRGAGMPRLDSSGQPRWFTSEQYINFWTREFKKRGFKKLPDVGFFTYHDRAGQITRNEVQLKEIIRPCLENFYCKRLDQWIHFLYTGELILCCMDYHRGTVFGNILDNNIDEIYRSKEFSQLAKRVVGTIDSPEDFICKKCISPGG